MNKIICIKDLFYPTGAHPYRKGTIYKCNPNYNGFWVYTKTCKGADCRGFDHDEMKEYFVTLAELREQRINSILNE